MLPAVRRLATKVAAITHFAPTRRLALLVFIVSPVWLASSSSNGQMLAVAVWVTILLAVLSDALRIPGFPGVSLARSAPQTIGLGQTATARYTVLYSWPLPLRGTISHRIAAGVSAALVPTQLKLTADEPAELVFDITGRIRGTVPLGPVALTIVGPWGLVRCSLVWYLGDTISIVPAMPSVGRYRLLAAQHRVRSLGQRTVRKRGAGSAFAGLREYTPGDDPRRIDWKATARRDRLITREFSVEQGQSVMLAIDAGRMMTQLSSGQSRFEFALSSALTLADVALSAGDRVGLIVFDAAVQRFILPSREPGTIGVIRDALVGVTATMTEPDYAAAFRTLVDRNRRRSLIVLFTDVVDTRSSRALIALTTRSAERHLPLVVTLRNEELVTASIPQAHSERRSGATEEAYRSVAAEELLTARDEALQSMRQAGVAVLDSSPTALTASLINRYLEIKDRSAL